MLVQMFELLYKELFASNVKVSPINMLVDVSTVPQV